ncbi:hypothetical protein QYE76_013463 [Lolium multiflorum]|uniref:Response regulatory domain-containing protein n=1 Tax=Lolium multiflorum TaxID=4521 RepID=A0AAD8X4V7_LOLMU|nr:hypothetical protein QYE76_013463 [Lolium multiflorum]
MENSGSASDVGYPSEEEVRILVVDEDPPSLITLTRMLKSCGYQVTAKTSPEEALREVRQKPEGSFDLVMTVACTQGIVLGNEPIETRTIGVLEGAYDYLIKPLQEKDLQNIWKHVSRWRINAANGSDPRWRRSAGAVNGPGEGSSRGVRQQKKRRRTTRKTQFNSLPNLHALFVEAAEVLQGTEDHRGSLTVAEAWALYRAGYPVPPDMRLPSSGGWRMAVNGIGVPPPPPGTDRWRDAIRARRSGLTADERADMTWAANGNDAWWVAYFQAQYDMEMNNTASLVGRRNTWNREGRLRF